MSDIIRVLPDPVANQIAAGEVVQRPASVVKELMENSLDAGAKHIQLVITDAGKTCIQVIDDGKGMSETDARMAFERHATSKIRDANDLFKLYTMGFRGEALPSIAAVSRVELRTRTQDDEIGTCVTIEGKNEQEDSITRQQPVACPVGANFCVKDLFFNLPVRRRFLKSDRHEQTLILVEFERIALAHPDIAMTFRTPDAIIMDLPANNFRQRIVNIFGKSLDKYLLNVKVETPVVEISGFVGSPESSKKKGVQQFFFVNGRYMKHFYFNKAVQKAFERMVPEGNEVPFFLHLVVNPSKIDVNIHPTKTEIKFEDEQTIWTIINSAVKESLGKFNAIPTIDFDTDNRPEIPVFNEDLAQIKAPTININPDFNPFESTPRYSSKGGSTSSAGTKGAKTFSSYEDFTPNDPASLGGAASFEGIPSSDRGSASGRGNAYEAAPADFWTPDSQAFAPTNDIVSDTPAFFDSKASSLGGDWDVQSAHFIQYKGRYMITPVPAGLLIIDSPRAHTRILYEEYLVKAKNHASETQGLLFAHAIELTPTQRAIYETMKDEIAALGFHIERTDEGGYSMTGVPAEVGGMNPDTLFLNILEEALTKTEGPQDALLHQAASTLARHTAIPVGQYMTNDEMRSLTAKLADTSNPNFTPDGKVIQTILGDNSIQSRFH